jgi:hypothetical protein
MKCDDYDAPALLKSLQHDEPRNEALSRGPDSSSSVSNSWSDASSQSSDDTISSGSSSDTDSCDSKCHTQHSWSNKAQSPPRDPIRGVAAEHRQNPRRTSGGIATRTGSPPLLVRQGDRKVNFVDNLVGKTHFLGSITAFILRPS